MKIYIIGDHTYAYQQKQWQLFDQYDRVVETVGSKGEALYAGISRVHPIIFNAAFNASNRHQENDGFVWRAAELVINGHVYEAREENQIHEVARVRSASFSYSKPFNRDAGHDRDGFFSIIHEGFLTCSCTSFHSDHGPRTKEGHKLCKHTLAVMLAHATDTPLERVVSIETELDSVPLDMWNEELFG